MRLTTVLKKLIAVTSIFATGAAFVDGGIVVDVRPTWRRPRCGLCQRPCSGYDTHPPRLWRHLSLVSVRIWLRYAPRRACCTRCNAVRVEHLPWAQPNSGFTVVFEELCAYLAQITDRTSVTKLLGIDWRTVGAIVGRVVERKLDPHRLEGLRRIGVDEFSYRKRHRYLTIVVDHDSRRVVWTGEGKGAAALTRFFAEIGPEACQKLETVTMDMSAGYRAISFEDSCGWFSAISRFGSASIVSKSNTPANLATRRGLARAMGPGSDIAFMLVSPCANGRGQV